MNAAESSASRPGSARSHLHEMSAAFALARHQFRFSQKIFWRNPASVFFTVLLPVIFLLIFATIFGNEPIDELGGVKTTTYYVPAIITLAVVSATCVSIAISLTVDRENGVLKRGRGTPMPSWVFFAGRVGNSIVVSVLMLVVLTAIGWLVYDVPVPWDRAPAVLVTLAVGAAAFCCLGIALTAIIPSEEAAPAITNVTVLPLYFLSGVFIPKSEIPEGVLDFASVFPILPFFDAFFAAFDPATPGAGFEWGELAVVAAWGVGGLLIAIRTFRWTPRDG
jgi:ABC-2 type transport system permease protein